MGKTITTTFAKVLLQGVANKMGVKLLILDDSRDDDVVICHFISPLFKDSSDELRRYWITEGIKRWAIKVAEETNIMFEAYTPEEHDRVMGKRLSVG